MIAPGTGLTPGELGRKLLSGPFCIAVHMHADRDALASAWAIQRSFGSPSIWAPGGLDRGASAMAAVMGIVAVESKPECSRLLVVDTQDIPQLDGPGVELMILDHHPIQGGPPQCTHCIDAEARSCSELALRVVEGAGLSIDGPSAEALAAGILADTGRFRRGSAATFAAVARLLEVAGSDIEHLLLKFGQGKERGEQIAVLKGLERMRHVEKRGLFLCSSEVSSYESSVASAIVGAGADASFVASDREGRIRVTARLSQRGIECGLDLPSILGDVARQFGGRSGGHAGAAVLECTGDPEALLNACISRCASSIRG